MAMSHCKIQDDLGLIETVGWVAAGITSMYTFLDRIFLLELRICASYPLGM